MLKKLPAQPIWQDLADAQEGVLRRCQLLDLGLTPDQAKRNVRNGRWQAIRPGVFATHTGPVGPHAEVWAAVLYAGPGAVASHATALWLAGLLDEMPRPIHIGIGHWRQVRNQPGLRIHRMSALDDHSETLVHPAARPPRVRIEGAVLDQAALSSAAVAVDLVLRSTQRRLTTPARLRDALRSRRRQRFRSLLLDVLADAGEGVASPLERHYLRDVERPHRLPVGVRNLQERLSTGGHWYRDVRYPAWQAIVELDGREAHPPDGAFRDLRRDNVAVVAGDSALRYGWRDVVGKPCDVAAQVAVLLQARGWTGAAQACGVGCLINRGSNSP